MQNEKCRMQNEEPPSVASGDSSLSPLPVGHLPLIRGVGPLKGGAKGPLSHRLRRCQLSRRESQVGAAYGRLPLQSALRAASSPRGGAEL